MYHHNHQISSTSDPASGSSYNVSHHQHTPSSADAHQFSNQPYGGPPLNFQNSNGINSHNSSASIDGGFLMSHHSQNSFSDDSKNTLWMGELDPWLDENAIRKIWAAFGETVNVKLIREKYTGTTAGYCFVEFSSPSAAAKALTLNGQPIPNSQRFFKLNWASGGGLADKRDDKGPEFSIFVGDLASEITEFQLLQLFQFRYPSCKSAKIMTDPQTNASRGYGFVRFTDESEMQRALSEMQGYYCGPRPMRISTATPKSKTAGGPVTATTSASSNVPPNGQFNQIQPIGGQFTNNGPTNGFGLNQPQQGALTKQHSHSQSQTQHQTQDLIFSSQGNGFYGGAPVNGNITATGGANSNSMQSGMANGVGSQPVTQFTDPNNTTVFVGGLSSSVTEDDLRRYFAGFGDITYVKIPSGKGCGFVQYVQRSSAEAAITKMQGYPIGNSRVRLSWGRSQNSNGSGNGATNNNNNNNNNKLDMGSATSSLNQLGVNMSMNVGQIGDINMPMGMNGSMNMPPPNSGLGSNNINGPSTLVGSSNIPPMPMPNDALLSGNGPYRAAPPPPIYPQMAMPPQQSFGAFGPINPQAAHMHPPPSTSPTANGSSEPRVSNTSSSTSLVGLPPQVGSGPGPGSGSLAVSGSGQDPSEPIPVARLNELYLAARDGRLDRVEGDVRGYHGVYAQ